MANVTISTKVEREILDEIEKTGYSVSEVVRIGVNVFLELPVEEQKSLFWKHYTQRKQERAFVRRKTIKLNRGIAG